MAKCPYHRYKDICTSVSVSPQRTFCLSIEAKKFFPQKNTSTPMFDVHEQRLSSFYLHRWTNRLHSYCSPNERMNGRPNWMCTHSHTTFILNHFAKFIIIACWCLLIFCNLILIISLHSSPFRSCWASRCSAQIQPNHVFNIYEIRHPRNWRWGCKFLYYDESINWFLSQLWRGEADFRETAIGVWW